MGRCPTDADEFRWFQATTYRLFVQKELRMFSKDNTLVDSSNKWFQGLLRDWGMELILHKDASKIALHFLTEAKHFRKHDADADDDDDDGHQLCPSQLKTLDLLLKILSDNVLVFAWGQQAQHSYLVVKQALLLQDRAEVRYMMDELLSVNLPYLCQDPFATHVIQQLIDIVGAASDVFWQLQLMLVGSFSHLATDYTGSFLVNKMMTACCKEEVPPEAAQRLLVTLQFAGFHPHRGNQKHINENFKKLLGKAVLRNCICPMLALKSEGSASLRSLAPEDNASSRFVHL